MKPALWWLPAGVFKVAGIILFFRRGEPGEPHEPFAPVTTAKPPSRVPTTTHVSEPDNDSNNLESADPVPPPHEVSPAPPFGFVSPPGESAAATPGLKAPVK